MIVSSAIKFRKSGDTDYTIMTAKRHPEVFRKMREAGIQYERTTHIQGFMTDDGRFLDRFKARDHAIACGQLRKNYEYPELFSEDLWPAE